MEIKTTRSSREPSDLAPEKGHSLRRKTVQRAYRSLPQRLVSFLPVLGKLWLLAFVAGFGVMVFNYAYTSEKFNLRSITFEGCKQINTKALEQKIRRSFPKNLLKIDLKELRGLVEAVPWVKQAEIRRILPSDLVIYVEERVPSVILEIKGTLMLADDEGVLLDKFDGRYGKIDVPVFRGFLGNSPESYKQHQEENSARVKLGYRMLAELEEGSGTFAGSISEVDLSDTNDVKLLLVDDTAEIHMGDADFLKRFRTLMSNMSQYQELKAQYNEIASIDLRFDGQIIYRPTKSSGGQSDVNVKAASIR
jgi:cell division protein FtsQ